MIDAFDDSQGPRACESHSHLTHIGVMIDPPLLSNLLIGLHEVGNTWAPIRAYHKSLFTDERYWQIPPDAAISHEPLRAQSECDSFLFLDNAYAN